jgi:hypothetical protein
MFEWLKRRKPEPEEEVEALPDGGFETLFGVQGPRYTDKPTGVGTVAIIGNCLAETLAAGLSSSAVLTEAFRFVAIPIHTVKLTDPDVVETIGRASHIFLQSNSAKQRTEIKGLANQDAEIVLFPDIVVRSLWPFDAQNGYADAAVVDTTTAVIRHPDGVLARLRTVEPDKAKRFQLYRDLAFEEARTIARIATAQERFFEQLDLDTEAGLGAFMAAGLREKPLFYNSTHPTPAVFQALAAFVWRKLEMAGRPPNFSNMDTWRSWSVPVHPRVAKLLGLTWATETTRYHYTTLGNVTWEQWARAYIDLLG